MAASKDNRELFIVVTVDQKMKLIESALARLKRDDAAEGVNFTFEEREVVIAALEVAVEIVSRIMAARTLP